MNTNTNDAIPPVTDNDARLRAYDERQRVLAAAYYDACKRAQSNMPQ